MLYNFCGQYDLSREERDELEQAFMFIDSLRSRIIDSNSEHETEE